MENLPIISNMRCIEYEFHTQKPNKVADFDALMKSIKQGMGLADEYLGSRDCAKSKFVPNVNFDYCPLASEPNKPDSPLDSENDHNHLIAILMQRKGANINN